MFHNKINNISDKYLFFSYLIVFCHLVIHLTIQLISLQMCVYGCSVFPRYSCAENVKNTKEHSSGKTDHDGNKQTKLKQNNNDDFNKKLPVRLYSVCGIYEVDSYHSVRTASLLSTVLIAVFISFSDIESDSINDSSLL